MKNMKPIIHNDQAKKSSAKPFSGRWSWLNQLNPWYFAAAVIVFGIISLVALRDNNQHMVELRAAVYAADKNGSDVTKPLANLRSYVYGHMNTNLATSDGVYPPIQLKYTYDRLVKAQSDQTAASNSQIYSEAQAYCEQLNSTDFSGRNRVPCITDYVSSHSIKQTPINDGLYKFDFISPSWSPDVAGWSIVLTVLSAIAGLGLAVVRRFR